MLLRAAAKGNLPSVRSLLSAKAEPSAADPSGDTALHVAALAGHRAVVAALVAVGANTELLGANGCTPLQYAAERGHFAIMAVLLDGGSSLEACDAQGLTVLRRTAARGQTAVAAHLLSLGASLGAGPDGRTALHWACAHGHVEVARLLLEAGQRRGADEDESAGAAVEPTGAGEQTAAGESPLHVASMLGHAAVAGLLLASRASPHVADADGFTPLHWAACNERPEVAAALLAAGARAEATDAQGRTALHWAAGTGSVGTAGVLLRAGASAAARDAHGRDALLLAVTEAQQPAVSALLALARPPAGDAELAAARLAAVMRGHAPIAALLRAAAERAAPGAGAADASAAAAAAAAAANDDDADTPPLRIGGDAPIGLSDEEAAQLRRVQQLLRAEAAAEAAAAAEAEGGGARADGACAAPTPLQRAVLDGDARAAAPLLAAARRRAAAGGGAAAAAELRAAWHLAVALDDTALEPPLAAAAPPPLPAGARWCARHAWEGLDDAGREAAWAEAAAALGVRAPKARLGHVWYAGAARRVRGLVATAPIARGEEVLRVPAACVLGDLALLASPLRALARARLGAVATVALLALLVLREGAARASPHMPYIKAVLEPALAEARELPATWPAASPRQRELSAAGRRKAAQLRAHLLAQHAALFPAALDDFADALAPDGGAEGGAARGAERRAALEALYAPQRFVETCAVLLARGVEKTVRATARGQDVACVPHFDLCNFAPSAERGLRLRFDCAAYAVVCTAKAPIAEGEEILYHYGAKDPEDFLQNYGFAMPGA